MSNSNFNPEDSEDSIPPDAPPELVILATNIQEILRPIHKIRGKEYTNQLLTLLTLFQQSSQLEEIACESVVLIIQTLPEYNKTAMLKHDTVHILADAITSSLWRLVDFHEKMPEFSGISKDLETLSTRIKTDWLNKQAGRR